MRGGWEAKPHEGLLGSPIYEVQMMAGRHGGFWHAHRSCRSCLGIRFSLAMLCCVRSSAYVSCDLHSGSKSAFLWGVVIVPRLTCSAGKLSLSRH